MRAWISRRLFKEMVTWEKCLPPVQISSIDSSRRKTMRFTNSYFLLCIWTCTYTQFHCPTQLFVGTTAPEDLCVYQVVQTSVDMLTLGNYILLVFCFSFLCEWLNVPCRSIEWNLFIRIVHLYAFYTVSVCYTSLWSCSRTRIMNKFVDIKQLFSFFQSFHLVRVFFYLF